MCSLESCHRPVVARGLCDTHYRRWKRHGSTADRPRLRRVCEIEGCGAFVEGHGFCHIHYTRWRRTGTADVRPRAPERNGAWAGDDVGYSGAHKRITKARGPAREHPCQDCAAPALHWSYNFRDPDERTSSTGRYSIHSEFYEPRCARCHKAFDNQISLAATAA